MHESEHSLRRLARAWGVQNSYLDLEGRRRVADPEALLAILRVLGAPLERLEDAGEALRAWRRDLFATPVDPVTVAWLGRAARVTVRVPAEARDARCTLALEGGETRTWEVDLAAVQRSRVEVDGRPMQRARLPLPDDLPMGYHALKIEAGGQVGETTVFAAPMRAYAAEGGARAWGAFLPLYALRTENDWGVGDVYDLGALAQWAASQGAGVVGTLPLLAAFLGEGPYEPSPYAPVSRLFWNELFLDATVLPELASSEEARTRLASTDFATDLEVLRSSDLVDYRAAYAHKRRILEPLSRALFEGSGDRRRAFEAFLRARPEVEDYARFRAAVEQRGESWWTWPEPQRSGTLTPADYDEAAYRTHLYAQFAFHEQLAGAIDGAREAGVELYLDLPIGVHPDGYDVWRERDTFALGMSAGAPPDPFFTGGQSWGFPPLNPQASRASAHRYFVACLRNHLRYARRLRIDHVMGLHRLYWIPEGFGAKEGVYVRYHADELFAALCIESHRAKAEIVGENLGTVPAYVDEAMRAHGVQGMYVGEFSVTTDPGWAIHPPEQGVLAALNTHDMPTFAGWWFADDVDDRVRLGFMDEEAAGRERWIRGEQRAALTRWLADRGFGPGEERVEAALEGSLAWLAGTEAAMVLVNLEDLWAERGPQNVPGTHRELPNWRRRGRLSFETFRELPDVLRVLGRVNDARKRGTR